jgi:hypothetical protein
MAVMTGAQCASSLTPGITRRPAPLLEHDNRRVGGRVHAVVRRVLGRGRRPLSRRPTEPYPRDVVY